MRKPLFVLIVIIGICFAAPLLTNSSPTRTNPTRQLEPPSRNHPLGTDYLGRDVYSRTIYGGRRTLSVSVIATAIALCIGVVWGISASIAPRIIQIILTASLDAWLSLPGLLIALLVLLFLGRGEIAIAIAVGLAQIAPFARITRASTLSILNELYITASHAMGATLVHIIRSHILPNIRPTIMAYTAMIFSYSIINSAALSLLGLGQDPSLPDWGIMLAEGRNSFRLAPWVALAPGIAISITIMAVHRLADSLTNE